MSQVFLPQKVFLSTPPTTVSTIMPTPPNNMAKIMSTPSNNMANIVSTPPTNVANIMSTPLNNVTNIMSTPPTNVANFMSIHSTSVADMMSTPPTNAANIMSIHSTSVANILPEPNQPQKNGQEIGTGFSHLDWSSSVPFNVAEEPDDVQGMKHSHSCQSMPVGPKLSDSCSQESPQLHSDTSKAIETALDTPFESSEKFLSKSSPSNSDSSEEQKSLSVSSEKLVKTQSQGPKVVVTNDQEVLSKKLEFARQRSRSTFLDRPRAKSEELMVVKQKFPHQMPDAQKKQNNSTHPNNNSTTTANSECRQRMQSDSCLQTADLKENPQKAVLRRKTVSVLQSPNLIQNFTESAKVKILPPPPKAFRDPEMDKINKN